MSAEEMSDAEMWRAIKRERQEQRQQRRAEFAGGEGWTKHLDSHWSYSLLGDRLDYWPGPKRWRWRKTSMTGNVHKFIAARIRETENGT